VKERKPPVKTEVPNTSPPSLLTRIKGLLARKSIRQRIIAPVAFDAAFLATTLITGIAVARALGATGRGEVTAILIVAQTAGWLFGMGASEAIGYRLAKEPDTGPRLIGTWLVACIPLTVAAVAACEIALPALFGAQTTHAMDLARIYVLYIPLIFVQGIFAGILIGDEDFLYFNVSRLLNPVLTAVGYLGVLAAGAFTVEAALIVNAVAGIGSLAVAAVRSLSRHGIGRFDPILLRETVWYGFKAHAGNVAGIINARLDLLIIPAFLSAASVGLYSVAGTSTSIVSTLTGTIAVFLLPVAARRGTSSARTVILTFQAVFAFGILLAIPLAILAHPILRLIYGGEFEPAVDCMRILLPGSIFSAAAGVLDSGLLAANRPFLASLATLPAAVFTVGGLIIFLQSGGIEAAAIVTTVAYTLSLAFTIWLYRRVAHLRWRDFIRAPAGATPVASASDPAG
jgi:O-antigen/teichoic acid export membrane protein